MTENPLYAELQAEASALLAEYGRSMKLVRVGLSDIDPVTDEEVRGPDLVFDATGILASYHQNLIDGSRIKAGDRKLILSADEPPLIEDKIRIFDPALTEWERDPFWDDKNTKVGETWTVFDVEAKQPAETVLVYILQVRR